MMCQPNSVGVVSVRGDLTGCNIALISSHMASIMSQNPRIPEGFEAGALLGPSSATLLQQGHPEQGPSTTSQQLLEI